ncbi:MAG: flagellar basal body P-ring formation protein FlgA [Planctomycetes bacterium]|nr:flagellar basal body P-ring formation protein FlgA [Planctomycetota bacterium]
MALLATLFASLLACFGDAAPADRLLVQLKPRVAVTHSPVVLADVAELHGPKAEVDRFAKLEICPAPAAGKPRLVSSAGVRLAARLAGLQLDADRIVGAPLVEVVANWIELSSDDLYAQAQRWVLSQTAELGDRVLLERAVKPTAMPLLDGAGEAEFEFAFVSKPRSVGTVQVKIAVRQGLTFIGDRVATFRVRRFGRQLRLLTAVRQGETVSAAQVMESEGEWSALAGTPVIAEAELDGKVATRDLEAGAVLTREVLEHQQLARKGDSVQLILKSGSLEIVLIGTAQRPGRKGDVVPVLNPTTQKVINAELIARNGAGLAVALVR